ncbi:MAG TPA: CvpA family protein [Hyphomicrobiaceae bacterium]|nr:CvpA family protein [Hyphomicrobiaceae bacterium]
MTWLDYAVLGVCTVSVGWGIWRGLVREVVSLAAFVIAFLAANLFAAPMSDHLPESIPQPEFRVLLAFGAIFFAALVLTSLGGLILSRILKAVGLGGMDRALGALFGLARAAVILLALALAAGLTGLPRDTQWTESASGPYLASAALALAPWLPPALSERLRYD